MSIFGSLISAGSSIGSSLLGGLFSANSQANANRSNMALAEYAYNKNLEQWNRENEYNTPANQLARLKAAGLNPNLMYSQGSVGNAGNSPSYDAPQISAYTGMGALGTSLGQQLGNAVNSYYENSNKEAQNELIKQQTVATQQQAFNDSLRAVEIALDAKQKGLNYRLANTLFDNSVRTARLQSDNLEQDLSNKRTVQELTQRNIALTYQQEQQLIANTNLSYEQARNISRRTDAIASEIALNIARANESYKHASNLETSGRTLAVEAEVKEKVKTELINQVKLSVDKLGYDATISKLESFNMRDLGSKSVGSGPFGLLDLIKGATFSLKGY